MSQPGTLSYEAICILIGKLVLQKEFEVEQLGKTITHYQQLLNEARNEIATTRQNHEDVREGTNH